MRYQHVRRHPEVAAGEVTVAKNASFGQNVTIDATGNVSIGDGTHLAHRVSILTHHHANMTGPPAAGLCGPAVPDTITIGNHVFIGEESRILPQVGSIGDWAVIGAYSVLTKSVGPGEIWAGNPAKFIRHRDGWEAEY